MPFKGKYKTARPAEAFNDTWHWTDENTEQLQELEADLFTRHIADIVRFAHHIEQGPTSLSAYLLNMAVRLYAMRRVLKKTGSIYLHCDPTASHYLKLIMDAVFGQKNFRNEIAWCYTGPGNVKRWFPRKHDIVLSYVRSEKAYFDRDAVRVPYNEETLARRGRVEGYQSIVAGSVETEDRRSEQQVDRLFGQGKVPEDWWSDIPILTNQRERMGYPTQKPLALLERIIKASCPSDGIVLDPFCGCGTTVHAAESLKRRWIGIDISSFATGLVRERLMSAFPLLRKEHISMRGEIPLNIDAALSLAQRDKFEFEKWVCGYIGAEGMFHDPGTPGADGGVDGVLKFYRIRNDKKLRPEYAIVQVKGGRVTPDSVRALSTTVDRFEVTAGVMVCFAHFMRTVENQRSRQTFRDALGTYPVIQGYSVENLLADVPLNLPLYGVRRQGARLIA